MKIFNVKNFLKGWMFGRFTPTLYDSNQFELAIKEYKAGDTEPKHYHKLAKEWTIVLYGEIEMNGRLFRENDLIEINPNEVVEFKSITDSKTAVVKVPSVEGDKYLV